MENNEQNLKTLPLELQFDILSRLPLKQLLRLKCLSRWWNVEISSSRFSKLYQQHRKCLDGGCIILVNHAVAFCFDFHSKILTELPPPPNIDSAYIFGSSNGLLLFVEPDVETPVCVLYNPVTGASALLPPLVINLPDHLGPNVAVSYGLHVGFGYDSQSTEGEDYKILRLISYRKQDEHHVVAYLYSTKMNSWKKIKPDVPNQRLFGSSPSNGLVYCNNAFHWISKNLTDRVGEIIISALNVSSSSGRYYVLPEPDNEGVCFGSLVVLKERLHLVNEKSFHNYDIWIMKEYGVQNSWTKLLHYTEDELQQICCKSVVSGYIRPWPYAYSADEQELLVGIEIYHMIFVCYNLQTRVMRKVQVTNPRLQTYLNTISSSVIPWMPSLAYPYS
ncbi:F-box protein CPR1-like [Silene latifolia]|uniref:F-box protein CPR1-like n=1 Tax=Silene latifolia TaxID=37657 RepID=UPI003D76FDFD